MRKYLFMIICSVAAMCLTSCYYDSDNEYHEITPQEIGQCLTAVKGNYTGKLLFDLNNPNDPKDRTDTLDIAWSVTADTMFNIKEFPQAVFLDRIADPELKKAVEQAAPAPLIARLAFYQINPISFLVYPASVVYNIEYEGATHTASLAFWINTSYSYGLYDTTNKTFQMQLMGAGLYLDDNMSHSYLVNNEYDNSSFPIVFTNVNLNK
jgi:hypothetical protein